MGHKIFISYKYGDTSVQRLSRTPYYEQTKVRDYVDELQDKLAEGDHINKGELDGEDLSGFKDSTIASKLRDKIYDSSVTIVLISPRMKEMFNSENDQWIPWEISYSLRETTRNDKTSRMNGILAVVLPNAFGKYNYMLEKKSCCLEKCTLWHTDKLFKVLRDNMFNLKEKQQQKCVLGDAVYKGAVSYINMIEWDRFINDIDFWINYTESIQANRTNYDIHVDVK